MKKVIIAGLLILSSISYGDVSIDRIEPIVPIEVCGFANGYAKFEIDKQTVTTVIDRAGNTVTRIYFQMVLRDPGIISYFKSVGAIYSEQINSKGEFIPGGFSADPYKGLGYFYSNDFGITKTVQIVPGNNSVILNAYSNGRLIANFQFNDCHAVAL